jgi:hypothetical protein
MQVNRAVGKAALVLENTLKVNVAGEGPLPVSYK